MAKTFKVVIEGVPYEFEGPEDAAAFAAAMKKLPAKSPASLPSVETTKHYIEELQRLAYPNTANELSQDARDLAHFIVKHPAEEFPSEILRKLLEAKSVEGVGPTLRWIRPEFKKIGIELDEVLMKVPGVAATWVIQENSDDYRKLEKLVKEGQIVK